MELSNEFTVSLPPERAFEVLTDVERIAPCLPGAELQEVEGESYLGVVKVKVGPITAQYKGKAHFLEKDAGARRVVLRAEGRDTRGQGNASATVTATLEPSGGGTKVSVATDLTITGKVAQFGRGVLADVSTKLLGQFVDSLEAMVAAEAGGRDAGAGAAGAGAAGAADTAGAGEPGTSGPVEQVYGSPAGSGEPAGPAASTFAPPGRPSAEPVDLLELAGSSVLKRVAPVAGAVLVLALLVWIWMRMRRSGE